MGERLPVSCGGGRSMRRSGGQHHVLNWERKLSGERRMSRMSRVGRACSGLGQNKAQGSPAPAAPTPLPAGTDTLLGEGSIRAGASPWLPTFGRAGGLPGPLFPAADVCWVQQEGPCCWCAGGGLRGPGCCALGMLQRCFGWRLEPLGAGGGSRGA